MPWHILVVEPKAEVGATIGMMLETAGYRVTIVHDGAAMREVLGAVVFDAVVLDATLFGEHSDSLATYAKELRLPLVMISGLDAVMVKAQEQHLQLLHKPFRLKELCDAVEAALASGVFGQRDA